ncbi:MAG: selenocysteine-specific translation elongation factor [Clostridiales bacterium GWB2_37_7]|nr:MAG: selenocysteine-specific translation elongation factor [Clostridiales bacterium GWB2_37_7]
MKNVIIGTAGHIDHGKTTLIKALTGRDTDRLKEEKERGISIDLGFTYFDLPSGRRAGIIDVPGHEKFIKNMLAGIGGIDVVVLVIAADEGVMPQTKEHLNILKLLQVKKGIIALTKKDLVDSEWLEMISEQVQQEVEATFLEEAKIIPVSSVKADGLKELIAEIDRLTEVVEQKDTTSNFRLPVDRIFTIAGFGTIVTGTLISGSIKEGDKVELYPMGLESRIRSIQVHEKNVKEAYAGQRVAINVANIKVEEIHRGDVLSKPGSMEPTMMIDAKIEMLKDAPMTIDNRDRLRLYHGTSEIMCRVVLLDREELMPGESAFVQLRLEEQMTCRKADRFVIRFYSPMITIAGGTIIDPNPPKRKRFKEDVLEELSVKEKGDPEEVIEQFLLSNSDRFYEKKEIIKQMENMETDSFHHITGTLKEKGLIVEFKQGEESYFAHSKYLKILGGQLEQILVQFHSKNPLKAGVSKEEIKSKLFEGIKPRLYDLVLGYYAESNHIRLENQYVAKSDFQVAFTDNQSKIKAILISKFRENMYNPPKLSDILAEGKFDKNQMQIVYNALVDMGYLVRLEEDIVFVKEAYEQAIQLVKEHIKQKGSIQLGEFRDLLGTSRKYAMALLDNFDQQKITKRVEDKRILY